MIREISATQVPRLLRGLVDWWPNSMTTRREAPELLDQPGHDAAELGANLRDIRLVNRLGGGTRVVLQQLPALLSAAPTTQPATILDVATGSGDIPHAIVTWARRRGRPVAIVASDLSPEILAAAAHHLDGCPEVTLSQDDARALPWPDGSFDIVLCSLALHHFPPDEAVAVLREMHRLCRAGFVVNDIRRGRAGYFAARFTARIATRNRLTRHDMPLSVLRAYTPTELSMLLAEAGIADAVVSTHPLFRMLAVGTKAVSDQPAAVSTVVATDA